MITPNMPTPPPNPFAAFGANPCAAVETLTAALIQLQSGQTPGTIRFEGQEIHFRGATEAGLMRSIQYFERLCRPKFATVRAGPHARWTRHRGYGFGGY